MSMRTSSHNQQFQPASKPQRGMPRPSRGRVADEEELIQGLDVLISSQRLKVHAIEKEAEVVTAHTTRTKRTKRWQNADRQPHLIVRIKREEETALYKLEQERRGILEARHQRTTETKTDNKVRRQINSRQRRLSTQTGIENHTNLQLDHKTR